MLRQMLLLVLMLGTLGIARVGFAIDHNTSSDNNVDSELHKITLNIFLIDSDIKTIEAQLLLIDSRPFTAMNPLLRKVYSDRSVTAMNDHIPLFFDVLLKKTESVLDSLKGPYEVDDNVIVERITTILKENLEILQTKRISLVDAYDQLKASSTRSYDLDDLRLRITRDLERIEFAYSKIAATAEKSNPDAEAPKELAKAIYNTFSPRERSRAENSVKENLTLFGKLFALKDQYEREAGRIRESVIKTYGFKIYNKSSRIECATLLSYF